METRIRPGLIGSLYGSWLRVASVINRFTTTLIGAAMFFLVITPVAAIMRLVGHDPMARRFDRNAPSYRIRNHNPHSNMERPF